MSDLNVLYEDNHIIVVEKPINMLSQSDATGDTDLLTLVKRYVKNKYHKPGNVYIGLVHRLDRPVGGVMVFARSSKAAARLDGQIRDHKFTKKYMAVVKGKAKSEDRLIDKIEKLANGNSIVSSNGKLSVLNYKLLEYNANTNHSLVDISLETGRHHQIRVQFSSRGFCLCGDQRYGVFDNTQLALFSYSLSFYHPISKELMTFEVKPHGSIYWTEFTL